MANGGKKVVTGSSVCLGKVSFQLMSGDFDIADFALLPDADTIPHTGIKINIDILTAYEKESTFRFTDATASKDATLSNLIVSNLDDDTLSDYKEYTLNPAFTSSDLNYEIELMEYIDEIFIRPKINDATATMKIKYPKRDVDDKLVYDSSGTDIEYEENDATDDTPFGIRINKLGEPDTEITIIVTAGDGRTIEEYKVVVKRPYGTIKGSIQLGNNLRDSMDISYGIYVEYIANATIYPSGVFDWDGILLRTSSLSDLDSIDYITQTQSDKDDGSYELYVIPGQYDLLLEKPGFLANVVADITISEGEVIDLTNRILLEGDVDRSGIIDLDDIVRIVAVSDSVDGDGVYDEIYDFGKKGYVSIDDLVSTVTNSDNLITIERY